MTTDSNDARRIAAEMVESCSRGEQMSLAKFASMADVDSSEEFARLAVKVAYFNAEFAAALLVIFDTLRPGLADQAFRDLKVRAAIAKDN